MEHLVFDIKAENVKLHLTTEFINGRNVIRILNQGPVVKNVKIIIGKPGLFNLYDHKNTLKGVVSDGFTLKNLNMGHFYHHYLTPNTKMKMM